MMLAARGIFLAARRNSKPTARSYVQDGLIAMWDGIENAGWGTHDAAATTWKDLIGTKNITLYRDFVVNDDHVFFTKSGYAGASFPVPYGAIEIVLSKNSSYTAADNCSVMNIGSQYSGYGLCAPKNRLMDTDDSHSAPYVDIPADTIFSATFNKSGITTTGIAKNGVLGASGTTALGSRYAPTGTNLINAPTENTTRNSLLRFYSIRMYSRNLTAADIAANHAVDKARFNLPDAT